LEADDVIAISATHICQSNPDDECFIVSSDGDYLQLSGEPRIHIYDLKFKDVKSRDPAYSKPDTSAKMFVMKRLCGDKSDNIPSAFPKCGKKTAATIADLANGNDDALFAELMRRGGEKAVNQYKHNDMLMNFQRIPTELREGFLAVSDSKFK
jgi:5'-3' exonuclease